MALNRTSEIVGNYAKREENHVVIPLHVLVLVYDFAQGGMSWFVTFPTQITTPPRGILRAAPIFSASENTPAWGPSGR